MDPLEINACRFSPVLIRPIYIGTQPGITTESGQSKPENVINLDDFMDIVSIKCKQCQFACNSKQEFVQHVRSAHTSNEVELTRTSMYKVAKISSILETRISSTDCIRRPICKFLSLRSLFHGLCQSGKLQKSRVRGIEKS